MSKIEKERGTLRRKAAMAASTSGFIALALVACSDQRSEKPTLFDPVPTRPTATAIPVPTERRPSAAPTLRPTLEPTLTPLPMSTPRPTPTKTVESTPVKTPEPTKKPSTRLSNGETYQAKEGDVFGGDNSINNIKQYDDDARTGNIQIIPRGIAGLEVRADRSDIDVFHTDGTERQIRKAVEQITAQMKQIHGQDFKVIVKTYGIDPPQGSSTPTTSSETPTGELLGPGEPYYAKKGDVIRFDGSINGVEWNDELGETGLIIIISEDGQKVVKASNGGEVYHTDGSPAQINKVVSQITTQLKNQHGQDFRVDVKTYETDRPQVRYVPLKVDARNQSEFAAFSVKEDYLDKYNGVIFLYEGVIVGLGLVETDRFGHIIIIHGRVPKGINIIPVHGDVKIGFREQDLQEILQLQIQQLRQEGFSSVIKTTDITYDEDGTEHRTVSLRK